MGTYDLEGRTLAFAKDVRDFVVSLPNTPANRIYGEQLLRSSGSIGANYIEANDALGRKDFLVKLRTSRREAKETKYWLQLVEVQDISLKEKQQSLIDESSQFIRILSSIISKFQSRTFQSF